MPAILVERPVVTPVKKTIRVRPDEEVELISFCPSCKTLETLWFVGGTLMTTRRFRQENGSVYHNCGSTKPCRLHRSA